MQTTGGASNLAYFDLHSLNTRCTTQVQIIPMNNNHPCRLFVEIAIFPFPLCHILHQQPRRKVIFIGYFEAEQAERVNN